jgi:hypothetical protein
MPRSQRWHQAATYMKGGDDPALFLALSFSFAVYWELK